MRAVYNCIVVLVIHYQFDFCTCFLATFHRHKGIILQLLHHCTNRSFHSKDVNAMIFNRMELSVMEAGRSSVRSSQG